MATHLLPPPRDHDDDGLDELLARTAPPVAAGDDVDEYVQALLQATRPGVLTPVSSGCRRRLVRRLALGAGAVALAASGASMAAADDDTAERFVREHAGQTVVSVSDHPGPGRCAAMAVDLRNDEPVKDTPAFRAAVAYISNLHVDDIDPTSAYAAEREELTQVDDGPLQPMKEVLPPENLLGSAYSDTVIDMLERHLAERGLEMGTWSIGLSPHSCQAPTEDQGPVR